MKNTETVYVRRWIYLVQDKTDNHIERIFGNEQRAKDFIGNNKDIYKINSWDVEFNYKVPKGFDLTGLMNEPTD